MIDKEYNFICEHCGFKDPVAFDYCPKCGKPSRLSPDYDFDSIKDDPD